MPFVERHEDVVQLFHVDPENLIAECTDRMYELPKTGEDDQHNIKLMPLEYLAQLRW